MKNVLSNKHEDFPVYFIDSSSNGLDVDVFYNPRLDSCIPKASFHAVGGAGLARITNLGEKKPTKIAQL